MSTFKNYNPITATTFKPKTQQTAFNLKSQSFIPVKNKATQPALPPPAQQQPQTQSKKIQQHQQNIKSINTFNISGYKNYIPILYQDFGVIYSTIEEIISDDSKNDTDKKNDILINLSDFQELNIMFNDLKFKLLNSPIIQNQPDYQDYQKELNDKMVEIIKKLQKIIILYDVFVNRCANGRDLQYIKKSNDIGKNNFIIADIEQPKVKTIKTLKSINNDINKIINESILEDVDSLTKIYNKIYDVIKDIKVSSNSTIETQYSYFSNLILFDDVNNDYFLDLYVKTEKDKLLLLLSDCLNSEIFKNVDNPTSYSLLSKKEVNIYRTISDSFYMYRTSEKNLIDKLSFTNKENKDFLNVGKLVSDQLINKLTMCIENNGTTENYNEYEITEIRYLYYAKSIVQRSTNITNKNLKNKIDTAIKSGNSYESALLDYYNKTYNSTRIKYYEFKEVFLETLISNYDFFINVNNIIHKLSKFMDLYIRYNDFYDFSVFNGYYDLQVGKKTLKDFFKVFSKSDIENIKKMFDEHKDITIKDFLISLQKHLIKIILDISVFRPFNFNILYVPVADYNSGSYSYHMIKEDHNKIFSFIDEFLNNKNGSFDDSLVDLLVNLSEFAQSYDMEKENIYFIYDLFCDNLEIFNKIKKIKEQQNIYDKNKEMIIGADISNILNEDILKAYFFANFFSFFDCITANYSAYNIKLSDKEINNFNNMQKRFLNFDFSETLNKTFKDNIIKILVDNDYLTNQEIEKNIENIKKVIIEEYEKKINDGLIKSLCVVLKNYFIKSVFSDLMNYISKSNDIGKFIIEIYNNFDIPSLNQLGLNRYKKEDITKEYVDQYKKIYGDYFYRLLNKIWNNIEDLLLFKNLTNGLEKYNTIFILLSQVINDADNIVIKKNICGDRDFNITALSVFFRKSIKSIIDFITKHNLKDQKITVNSYYSETSDFENKKTKAINELFNFRFVDYVKSFLSSALSYNTKTEVKYDFDRFINDDLINEKIRKTIKNFKNNQAIFINDFKAKTKTEKKKKYYPKNYLDFVKNEYSFYDNPDEILNQDIFFNVSEINVKLKKEFMDFKEFINPMAISFKDLYNNYKNGIIKFQTLTDSDYELLTDTAYYNDFKYIDETFKKLNEEEKNFLSYCFCYLKNQIKFYIKGSAYIPPNETIENKNDMLNLEEHNREILLFILPFIKNFSEIKNMKNLSEIFIKLDDEKKFVFSNMNYNLCDSQQNLKIITFEEVKNYLVNQIIIFLETLEKSFCRLMVNWYNIHPLFLKLNDKYKGSNILIANDLQVFKNSLYHIIGEKYMNGMCLNGRYNANKNKSFDISKINYITLNFNPYVSRENYDLINDITTKAIAEVKSYKKSKFYIDYENIKKQLLKQDKTIINKNFLNDVFPISTLYNALYYYPSLKDEYYSPLTNNIVYKYQGKYYSPMLNNKSIKYLVNIEKSIKKNEFKFWDSLSDEEKENFYMFLVDNNYDDPTVDTLFQFSENKFKFLLSLLFYSGTLSCVYKNKSIDEKKFIFQNDYDYLKPINIFYQFEKDPYYLTFKDCYFFLNNSSYENINKQFKEFITAENNIYNQKINVDKRGKIIKKTTELKVNKINSLSKTTEINKNLLINRYTPIKWKKTTNFNKSKNNILYSAELLAQLAIYNKFINCRVSFITGDTGTGKSTQFPILILYGLKAFDFKNDGSIIDTQPRRNAVENNALAVSSFLGQIIPICYFNKHVQYQTGDTDLHYDQEGIYRNCLKIKFVTDRILLNMIYKTFLFKRGTTEDDLQNKMKNAFDVVIIDEAHEHNVNMDFILTVMRNIIYVNNTVRLMIVSATMDDDEPRYRQYYRFIEDMNKYPLNRLYFNNDVYLSELDRRINVSNPVQKTYNITDLFIDDEKIKFLNLQDTAGFDLKKDGKKIEAYNNYNTLKILNHEIKNNKEAKNFLVFKSGENEILECIDYLINNGLNDSAFVIPWLRNASLGVLNILDICQKQNIVDKIKINRNIDFSSILDYNAFYEGQNHYKHIIFVATNIVEASVTIDALTHVIDDGLQKVAEYNYESGGTEIIKTPISNQSRLQRRGRVGRIGDGWVYYLYTYKSIKDNKVIYKICNEDITELYFSLLNNKNNNNKVIIDLSNDPNYLNLERYKEIKNHNCQIEDVKNKITYEFDYRKFLDDSYKDFYDFSRKRYGKINIYSDKYNESFGPFYIEDKNLNSEKAMNDTNIKITTEKKTKQKVYDSSGFKYEILNDFNYAFYIIHPREKYIRNRDLLGHPNFYNPEDDIKENFIIYCQHYFFNLFIKYDFENPENGYIKTVLYDKFFFIFQKLTEILDHESLNNYIYNFVILMALSYNYGYYEEFITFFYSVYFYLKGERNIKFECLPNQYQSDYEYLKDHIKHKEKRTKEEEFILNTLQTPEIFIIEVFKDEKVIEILESCKNYLVDQKDLKEKINFNKLLVLCFGNNIIKTYKNSEGKTKHDSFIYTKNKYFCINLMNPVDKIIKFDFENSVFKSGESPYINGYALYFSSKYKGTTKYISFIYPVSINDLKVLKYFFIFKQQLNNEISPYDYLINKMIEETNEDKKQEYRNIIDDVKIIMKDGYSVFDYSKI